MIEDGNSSSGQDGLSSTRLRQFIPVDANLAEDEGDEVPVNAVKFDPRNLIASPANHGAARGAGGWHKVDSRPWRSGCQLNEWG